MVSIAGKMIVAVVVVAVGISNGVDPSEILLTGLEIN